MPRPRKIELGTGGLAVEQRNKNVPDGGERSQQGSTLGIRAKVLADDGKADRSRRYAFSGLRAIRYWILLSSRKVMEENAVRIAAAGNIRLGEKMVIG